MLTSNKKWFTGIAMGIVILLVSLTLFAQNQTKKNNSANRIYDSSWWNYNIPAQYSLSSDQITQMNDIRYQTQQQILPLQNKLGSLQIEMRGYASGYDADVNKIKEYRNQIRDLEDQISDLQLNSRSEINKVLTKEQLAYFNQGGYGWWHTGRGMMSGYGHYGYDNCDYDYGMRGRGNMGNWRGGCW